MLSNSPRLGMIGFGEVGYHMAKGLKGAGVGQVMAFNNGNRNRPPYSDAFKQKAGDIGVVLAATMEELVRGSDIVLSAVVPTAALEIAREASPYLTSSHLFVDLNSCSPAAKEEGRGLVLERGARYVDGAIMDRPVSEEHRVCIFASGEGAGTFHDAMTGFGMNIRVISGRVGDAALLKMIYSIIAKGMQALLLESFEALYRAGLDPDVYEGLNNMVSQSGLIERAGPIIAHTATHAGRRAGEMEFVGDTLLRLGVEPTMAQATAKRLTWCAGLNLPQHFPQGLPSSYKAVFEVVNKLAVEGQPRN